jgi:hypothetical protein
MLHPLLMGVWAGLENMTPPAAALIKRKENFPHI